MANLLNESQIQNLLSDWNVYPIGFNVNLYRDDFDDDVWKQICEKAIVNYDIDKLTLLCIGTKINE